MIKQVESNNYKTFFELLRAELWESDASGIRQALMDNDGTNVPLKDEAYYKLVSCCTLVNYLRKKVKT